MIHLPNGLTCEFRRGECSDHEGGQIFWERIPKDPCKFDRFVVLYEGPANVGRVTHNNFTQSIYSVRTKDTTFALTQESTIMKCGFQLILSEHPQLFLLLGSKGSFFTQRRLESTKEMSLFTYINSKFVYVENHIRTQIQELHRDVVFQRCLLEQKVLRNSLSMATISPGLFALEYMQREGYYAMFAGKAVYLIKCIPVSVKLRQTTECWQDLPVLLNDKPYFLNPRTRLLVKKGNQISCNHAFPSMWEIDNVWYIFNPHPVATRSPSILQPSTQLTWEYDYLDSLAQRGILTQEQLQEMNDDLMFASNQPAILTTIARRASGKLTNTDSVDFGVFIDAGYMEKQATKTWNKFWTGYTKYGTYSAGILMTLLLFKIAQKLLSTLVNIFALHSIFRCSYHLTASCWTTLVNLLIHRHHHRQRRNETTRDQPQNETAFTELQPTSPSVGTETEQTELLPTVYPRLGLNK